MSLVQFTTLHSAARDLIFLMDFKHYFRSALDVVHKTLVPRLPIPGLAQ